MLRLITDSPRTVILSFFVGWVAWLGTTGGNSSLWWLAATIVLTFVGLSLLRIVGTKVSRLFSSGRGNKPIRILSTSSHKLSSTDDGMLESGVRWPVVDPESLSMPAEIVNGVQQELARAVIYLKPGHLESLPHSLRDAYEVVAEIRDGSRDLRQRMLLNVFIRSLSEMDIQKAREELRMIVLPNISETQRRSLVHGKRGQWASRSELKQGGYILGFDDWYTASLTVGRTIRESDSGVSETVQFHGEGHLTMIAPPGTGKNQNFILPNLYTYEGPVICLDPKGENYDQTAWSRQRHGDVYRFSPWADETDCFNPLDFVDNWDDARSLTSLLVIPEKYGAAFWDKAATQLITAIIWYLKTQRPREEQTLRQVLSLVSASDYYVLIDDFEDSDDPNLKDAASSIHRHVASKENTGSGGPLDSIFEAARTHMEIWSSEDVAAATSRTTKGFDPVRILRRVRDQEEKAAKDDSVAVSAKYDGNRDDGTTKFKRGVCDSVFVVIPPDKIREYAPVIRVLLGWTLRKVIDFAGKYIGEQQVNRRPIMFIFDELPQLGHMELVEQVAPIARGYGIRLWLVAQSLSQLQKVYPQWEAILSGSNAEIFFSPGDVTTADYLSRRLGSLEDPWGNRVEVAPISTLMGDEFQGKAIVFFRGQKPALIELNEPYYSWLPSSIRGVDRLKAEWTKRLLSSRKRRRSVERKALAKSD